jgi:hypothetical protein
MDYDDFTGSWMRLYVGLVRKVITWGYIEISVGSFSSVGRIILTIILAMNCMIRLQWLSLSSFIEGLNDIFSWTE